MAANIISQCIRANKVMAEYGGVYSFVMSVLCYISVHVYGVCKLVHMPMCVHAVSMSLPFRNREDE